MNVQSAHMHVVSEKKVGKRRSERQEIRDVALVLVVLVALSRDQLVVW